MSCSASAPVYEVRRAYPALVLSQNVSEADRILPLGVLGSFPFFPKPKKSRATGTQREMVHRMYGAASSRSRRPIRKLIDQGEPS